MAKVKLNKKYIPLFKSNSRFFIITGGRGSSKSFSVSYWAALLLLFEDNHTILFTRYTMVSAHISIIPEFVNKLELMGMIDNFDVTKDSIINRLTGSKIIFKGIKTANGDQTANLKSIQGVTTWILDEAEELMDEKTFDTIQLSVRSMAKQNRIILIMNPSTKVHWIYKRFFEDNGVMPGSNETKGDTTYIHTTFKDNKKNLDISFIKELEAIEKKNPLKYAHIVLGGWLNVAEGVIFTNWKIGEFNTQLEYGYGMDFGYNPDPTTLIKVAIDKKNKIIYLNEEIYETNLKSTELAKRTKNLVSTKEVIADNSENRLIDELRDENINVIPCIKGAGSVEEGIMILSNYEFIVTSNSTNIIKELNNYIWSNKKAGVPRDLYNHAMDAIRYYVAHKSKNSGALWTYGS